MARWFGVGLSTKGRWPIEGYFCILASITPRILETTDARGEQVNRPVASPCITTQNAKGIQMTQTYPKD